MNGGALFQAEHIDKSYGKHIVLKDVSLEMQRGEIVGIVGENGAGKSTLLKILMGLLAPDAGNVVSQGIVGYCPQEAVLFETLTVSENFLYFATAYGLRRTKIENSWEEAKNNLLDYFRFGQYENRLVSELSGGTKQKLNLSLALLHSPDILILDEPYSGFDWETYLRFWSYTEELQSKGKSILVVSHLVNDRSKFNSLYALKEGNLECA
ncbi:MAG: ABC transporter ATP-binding protein [Acidobacteria bacterium]|nr:ABC transporter ATP-binding protein [Acidobacteriota bacterium]MCA1639539.1 ABC transporter ATP-binding protein [Acidobacteriota bacterium]